MSVSHFVGTVIVLGMLAAPRLLGAKMPWWLDFATASNKSSPEESRARKFVLLIWGAITIPAVFILNVPISTLHLPGNVGFLVLVAMTFPSSMVLAKWIASRLRPELFKDAEENWRKRQERLRTWGVQ